MRQNVYLRNRFSLPLPSLLSRGPVRSLPVNKALLCPPPLFFFRKKKGNALFPVQIGRGLEGKQTKRKKKKKNQRSGWSKRRGQDRSSTNKQAKGNKTTKTGRRQRARRVELTTLSSPAPFPPAPRYLPHHQPPPSSRQQRPEPSSPPRPLRFTLGGGRTWRRGAGGCSGRATTFWQIPL